MLDLFCGVGGAAKGYQRAGFYVVGVDINPQPNYCGDEFVKGDALDFLSGLSQPRYEWPGERFVAVHASPPCQFYANVTKWRGTATDHSDLLGPTLDLLRTHGSPWVVENVPEAIGRPDLILCGSMFGLKVKRHRHFLTSWSAFGLLNPCKHADLLPFMHKGERAYADALGCEWMSNREARQAIPPAYTEWIGQQLLEAVTIRAAGRV